MSGIEKQLYCGNTKEIFLERLLKVENQFWKATYTDKALGIVTGCDIAGIRKKFNARCFDTMIEDFYGRLAQCAMCKGYSFIKELKKLMKRHCVVTGRRIAPACITVIPEEKRKNDLIELATDLYWLDNSTAAADDIFRLFAKQEKTVTLDQQSIGVALSQLSPGLLQMQKVYFNGNDVVECSVNKPKILKVVEDNKRFPMIQYCVFVRMSRQDDAEFETLCYKPKFPLLPIVFAPFIKIVAATMNVTPPVSEGHNLYKPKAIIDRYLNTDGNFKEMYQNERDITDQNGNMLFNQSLIYSMMAELDAVANSFGIRFEDILATGTQEWSKMAACVKDTLKNDLFTPLRTQKTQDPQKANDEKRLDTTQLNPFISDNASSVKESIEMMADNDDMSLCYVTNRNKTIAEAIDVIEDGEDFNIGSIYQYQNFISLIIVNLMMQVLELRGAEEPVDVKKSTGKYLTTIENQQKIIEKLTKENRELKEDCDRKVKAEKENASRESRRLKDNYNAAQDELSEVKKQLLETRENLQDEILARLAMEDEAGDDDIADANSTELAVEEECIDDETLVAEIRTFTKNHKVAVVGGTVYWQNRLRALYPDIEFYRSNAKKGDNPSKFATRTAIDYMIANIYNTSHALYGATTRYQRDQGIPLFYMPYGQSVTRFNEVMKEIMAKDKEEKE